MAQFDLYANRSPDSRERVPFLLDVQSDLLGALATRVVVPLAAAQKVSEIPIERLMPSFEIDGRTVVMLTPQVVGVPCAALGPRIGSLGERRHEIIAALDVLISGV